MANILNRQHYHKGDRIFRNGDGATSAYLIQAGSVDIVIGQGDGEQIVGTLVAGEIFGEMALLDDAPRSAAAVARESTTCVLITRTDFQKRVDKSDPFIRALLMLLTKRLRGHDERQGGGISRQIVASAKDLSRNKSPDQQGLTLPVFHRGVATPVMETKWNFAR